MNTIALVPYWLGCCPKILDSSDHFWWFRPISHFDIIIYVGPYIYDQMWPGGDQISISLKVRSLTWSIDEIESRLRDQFSIRLSDISLVWHVIEASSTCRVQGLEGLRCPMVAVVADTHHLVRPISSLVPYIRASQYTHVTCTHNQHTPFFSTTCDVATFSYPYTDLIANQAFTASPTSSELIYYGSLFSRHHFFRTKYVNRLLANSQINIHARLTFREWLQRIRGGGGQIFSCSLNGSFSFQTLYPLLYGNMLMTDPICSANWIGSILPSVSSCMIYKNMSECLSLAASLANTSVAYQAVPGQISINKRIQSCLADHVGLRKAFQIGGLFPDALPNTYTSDQHALQALLIVLKGEFGVEEVEKFIVIYERLQELHRLTWDVSIAPIPINCRKAEIYHSLLSIIPALLPRLSYPVLGGTPFQGIL
jgi:hypothetical protein